MTDWADHLARGRRLAEALFWAIAAAVVALAVAAGAALAAWFDLQAGQRSALEDAVLIDLNALPPAQALAHVPDVPQPEAEDAPPEDIPPPEQVEEITPPLAEAEPAPTPEEVEPPQVEDPPEDLPQVASNLPEPPPPPPKPKRAGKPDPKRTPKPAKVAEAKPAAPQQASAPAAGRKGTMTANERARFLAKISGQVARHLKRKRYYGNRLSLVVSFRVDGSGGVSNAALAQSSGDAGVDAAVLAQLRRLGKVAAPPDGRTESFAVAVTVR